MKEKKIYESVRDWRWLIGVCMLAYALLVIALPSLRVVSEKQLLQGLGVAALDHPLMDLRAVAAWCETSEDGKDPAVEESWIRFPGTTEQQPVYGMNYAPLVLLFGKLGKIGLSAESLVGWAAALTFFYMAALWLLCGPCSLQRALLWSLLICSPASVLVVERGNLDMMLFVLLLLALVWRKYSWAETVTILAASLLKFFPIAALLAPWKEGQKSGRAAAVVAFLGFLIFLAAIHSRLAAIGGSLSGQDQTAFGSSTLVDIMIHYGILGRERVAQWHTYIKFAALIGLSGAGLAGYLLSRTRVGIFPSERSLHSFFLTAPIMLGLFILGPQMDYKWIFFLFMVPVVLEMIHSPCHQEALIAKAWLAAITLYSYWTFFSDEGSLRNALLKQIVMWCAMLLSAFLTGALWNRKTSP